PFPLNNGEFYSVLFNQPQNTSSVIGQQIPINEWTHLLITFDGITQKQFVNGVFTSQINSPNGFELNQLGTSGISIGVSNQANGYWSPFNGIIDDIGIWNRALTQQEITNLFNGCSASTITSQPTNQTVNPTTSAQFVVNATSGSSFQWQTDLGLGFQNLSNAGQYSGTNNDTLVVSNASISNNNQQFRCIVNLGSCADTSDIAVLSVSTVGMNELSVQGNVSLYPNPTQSSFEIQTNLVYSKIEIRDMQGRLVKTEKAAKTINLSSLQKGTYSVNLLDEQENTLAVRKIVLQ
ncbi:MAG: T9SS C-terminal target domain-containing protein, partial [Crocinitomicaceae bacterium]|nr:T9SS C-terminal target domain-containing protein [Crocinitomicaceae bacterium]